MLVKTPIIGIHKQPFAAMGPVLAQGFDIFHLQTTG